jgi:hypothetical protein
MVGDMLFFYIVYAFITSCFAANRLAFCRKMQPVLPHNAMQFAANCTAFCRKMQACFAANCRGIMPQNAT